MKAAFVIGRLYTDQVAYLTMLHFFAARQWSRFPMVYSDQRKREAEVAYGVVSHD